jgi:hypothetical protein
MQRGLISGLLLFFVLPVYGQQYSGPTSIGPFSVDRPLSFYGMLQELGATDKKHLPFGYRLADRSAFLVISGSTGPDVMVGALTLSDFSPLKPSDEGLLAVTKVDFRTWKTSEKIGLGSSEEDVLKAYGKPSGQIIRDPQDIGGSDGDQTIIYKGRIRQLVIAATFGLRGRKVSSMKLSKVADPGPVCVGPFCGNTSFRSFSKLLGKAVRRGPEFAPYYCYQSKDQRAFLQIRTGHEEPPEVDQLFLSDFVNCLPTPQEDSAQNFSTWKTPEEIGLGSSEDEVLKVYGVPSRVEKLNEASIVKLILGFRSGAAAPKVGDKRILYIGLELYRAEFGIRDGRVSYIWLSESE